MLHTYTVISVGKPPRKASGEAIPGKARIQKQKITAHTAYAAVSKAA